MENRERFFCHHCQNAVPLEGSPGRRDECPHCAAELHVCRNCGLFDPRLSRGCREPQADEVRELERANFCGFFIFREGKPQGGDGPTERDRARAAFEALFRK